MNKESMLDLMATKMAIEDINVRMKAREIHRRLQLRSISNPVVSQVDGATQAIICLDIASRQIGSLFNKEAALQYSGMRQSKYNNSFHSIQTLLGMDADVTISSLCRQFLCGSVEVDAQKLIDEYQMTEMVCKSDFKHPQYATMAVYCICRLSNIKVPKSNFLEISRLKRNQWSQLEAQFMKVADSLGFTNKKDIAKNAEKSPPDVLQNDILMSANARANIAEENYETYDVWKARMLEQASK